MTHNANIMPMRWPRPFHRPPERIDVACTCRVLRGKLATTSMRHCKVHGDYTLKDQRLNNERCDHD